MRVVEIPKTSVTSSKIAAIMNRSPYRDVIAQYKIDTKQDGAKLSRVRSNGR
jgi:hypothetical protein